VRATGTLLQKCDARGAWVRGQPRMMAVRPLVEPWL
jgi:hypothetical protein